MLDIFDINKLYIILLTNNFDSYENNVRPKMVLNYLYVY